MQISSPPKISTVEVVGLVTALASAPSLNGARQYDRHKRRRQSEEQPQRRERNHFHAGNIQHRAGNHHRQRNPPSAISLLEPGEHAGQIGYEQRRINRHVENGRHQREPRFLKSPEISHRPPHPGVVAAFVGQGARKLADHERRGQAPEQRREQQNQNRASVAGAMHDVFRAIGSARHHKEGGGDQRPQREANEFFPVGSFIRDDGERLGVLGLLTRGASCCQFRCLPPQATHSQQLPQRAGYSLKNAARAFRFG